uniref:28S ribosomal protein S22, mitochondrial n=1 Tax=Syphacia muris TaxID=451379 RepID=A0A158R3S9_9BILA
MLKNKLLIVCKRLKLAALQHGYNFRIQRSFSADNPMPLLKGNNVERMFTNAEVQKILLRLTGVNLEKIFAERVFDRQERSHFALMTKEMYDENIEKMKVEAKHFLQFVPIKEPRETKLEVLSKEPAIASFDNSKFVFVDITFDATNQNRTVVVRETDGTLRVATPEEHDRMNRVFFAQPDRPVNKPHLFEDPYLAEALNRNEHEYVLDYACYFFEPDDPEFVKLYRDVFDRTISKSNFDLLRSTRHFGPLVFYMVINNRIDPILNYFASTGSLTDTADLIRLYKVVFPNWRVAIGTEDTERKIIFVSYYNFFYFLRFMIF